MLISEKNEVVETQEIENRNGPEATNPEDDDQEPEQTKKKRKRDNPYVGWDFYFDDEGKN